MDDTGAGGQPSRAEFEAKAWRGAYVTKILRCQSVPFKEPSMRK